MEEEEALDRMDVDDASELRLLIEINRRIPINHPQRDEPHTMPNYEGRRSDSRSLYGWAPGSDDEDDDHRRGEQSGEDQIQPFLHTVLDRTAPSTSTNRQRRHEPTDRTPPILTGDDSSRGGSRWRSSPMSTTEPLLQSSRAHSRSPRDRTLESYLLEWQNRRSNGASGNEHSEPSSSSRAYRYRPDTDAQRHGDNQRRVFHSHLRARARAYQRYRAENAGDILLKDTINYLDRLRYSNSFEESISSAAASFMSLDNVSWKDSDFIFDTNSIAPPAACSWLRPGVIFSGCQRAANTGCSMFSQRAPATSSAPTDPMIVNGSDNTRISVHTTSGRRYLANSRDENWPVKVTIHNINYEDMTLSGTMEAYNIPDKTSPTHDAHIVTFLEGEIIDFNKHTLETKNFKADADIDSTYWRELQPFKDLTDAEIAKKLLSRKWVTEKLAKGWILMRWKGMCVEFTRLSSFLWAIPLTYNRTMLHLTHGLTSGPYNLRILLHLPSSRGWSYRGPLL